MMANLSLRRRRQRPLPRRLQALVGAVAPAAVQDGVSIDESRLPASVREEIAAHRRLEGRETALWARGEAAPAARDAEGRRDAAP